MKALALLPFLLLSGCDGLEPALAHTLVPKQHCVATGVTWTLRGDKQSWGAGCIEQAPYPGMVRPGHGA